MAQYDNTEMLYLRELDLAAMPRGRVSRCWLHLVTDGLGLPINLPILVARGHEDGVTLGLTAAVHGNEINGIPVIQRIFREIDLEQLRGTLVGIPVMNVPAFHRRRRRFVDDNDLNHIFPGREDGDVSQVYAWRFLHRVVKEFDFLIDLHTASFGRVNSYYIRADLKDPVTREIALLQNAQIIVHNPPSDGTLRGQANAMGIPAVTLEVGDPNTFQKGMIRSSLSGVHNVMVHLGMTEGYIDTGPLPPVLCERSFWMYTQTGGILQVKPQVTEMVKKGQLVANLHNIFGDLVEAYHAPADGIVIGKSVSPVNQTGGRILHLGLVGKAF